MENSKKVILVVEDYESIQQLYKIILEESGDITVISATTLEEFKQVFEENKNIIDAIIVDGQLPDGNTVDLVSKIRAGGFKGNMMANSGDTDINKKLISAGCNLCHKKPTSLSNLINILS